MAESAPPKPRGARQDLTAWQGRLPLRAAAAGPHSRTQALRDPPAGWASPAESEWLLDNYYVVEEVVREVRVHLPRSYYHELPALQAGPLAGLPRIYALAGILL